MVEQYLGYLSSEIKASKTTVRGYGSDLRAYSAWLGIQDIAISDVKRDTAKAYLRHLNERLAVASVRRNIAACRSFYAWLIDEHLVSRNPFSELKMPKVERRLPRYITPDDFTQAVSFPMDTMLDVRDHAILELLVSSGIRIGELESLNIENVDMTNGELRFIGKGNRERVVPFGDMAANALSLWFAVRDRLLGLKQESALFVSYCGERIQAKGIQKMFRTRMPETLGRMVTPHQLRHSCATWMRNGGADLADVAEQLGHDNLQTTRRFYAHVGTERMRQIHTATHPRANLTLVASIA